MTAPTVGKIAVVCGGCAATREVAATVKGNGRIPKGWKRRPDPEAGADAVLCGKCWGKLYRLRAVTFPVQGVHEGGTWAEFCAALRQSLFRSRTLAQWAVNQLAATDVARTLDVRRMPPHPPLGHAERVYLYGHASRTFADWGEWEGAYTAAQAVLRAVELKYGEKRRAVVWDASESVPTIRSQPYPVPAQSWTPSYVEHASEETEQVSRIPAVSVPLDGQRWLLRLRGGRRRARQLGAFARMVSGEAESCELAIYRKKSQANRDRSGTGGRAAPGGGSRARYDIMIKMVAWLPRDTRDCKSREGVLSVHSSLSAFLVAIHPDFERPWILNRNEVRRRIQQHQCRLDRIAEDTKAEVRPMLNPRGPWRPLTPEERHYRRQRKRAWRQHLDYYDKICRLYRDYVDTFVKEASAWLAAYADRVNVAQVVLDLSERSYCSGFPWAALRERIGVCLEGLDRPIELVVIGGEESPRQENSGNGAGAEATPEPNESQ